MHICMCASVSVCGVCVWVCFDTLSDKLTPKQVTAKQVAQVRQTLFSLSQNNLKLARKFKIKVSFQKILQDFKLLSRLLSFFTFLIFLEHC